MASSEGTRQAIELRILSPSAEIGGGGLRFQDVPVEETIGQLRERIRNAVSTQPTNERQRLIYLGRALVRDGDTLRDVFGASAVCTTRRSL